MYQNLTPPQTKIAGLLAYECLTAYQKGTKDHVAINTARFACSLVGITDDQILSIIDGKVKGLPVLSKLSGGYTYEFDYKFNLY
jgi:hypothetical protein